jgi:hypothetical protein
MSNLSAKPPEQTQTPNAAENQSAAGTTKTRRWSFIQNDLEKALNSWRELEQTATGLSPEEEQLAQIKSIISDLKKKLEEF